MLKGAKKSTKRRTVRRRAGGRATAERPAGSKGAAPRRSTAPRRAAARGKVAAPRQAAVPSRQGATAPPRQGAAVTRRRQEAGAAKALRGRDLAAERGRAQEILARLERIYPGARCSLDHGDSLQLLVATILSAQCTDARVNQVTPALFRRYRTAQDYAAADPGELEASIRSTGFYRNKTRHLIECCRALVERHGGRVPADLDSLVELPGIGRKTANVVLGNAFGIPGVVVDTHVSRLARLLALTEQNDPNKIEFDLMEVVPRDKWTELAHLFIEHGRRVCVARRPRCAECVLNDLCPSSEV